MINANNLPPFFPLILSPLSLLTLYGEFLIGSLFSWLVDIGLHHRWRCSHVTGSGLCGVIRLLDSLQTFVVDCNTITLLQGPFVKSTYPFFSGGHCKILFLSSRWRVHTFFVSSSIKIFFLEELRWYVLIATSTKEVPSIY